MEVSPDTESLLAVTHSESVSEMEKKKKKNEFSHI